MLEGTLFLLIINDLQEWYTKGTVPFVYLRSDSRMKAGKDYHGVLRRDVTCEEFHYNEVMTFVETTNQKRVKRNPHIYEGEHITVTRRDDGTYHPNFRPIHTGPGFSVAQYATDVANELLWALEGLVER